MGRRAMASISISIAGGLAFSAVLMKLGSDMDSPELLKYLLISTLPLSLVLLLALFQLRLRSVPLSLFAAFVLGGIMCVPLESIVYVISEWSLRGADVFGRNNLQTLVLILLAWATIIALLAWLGMLAKVLLARDRDQKNW